MNQNEILPSFCGLNEEKGEFLPVGKDPSGTQTYLGLISSSLSICKMTEGTHHFFQDDITP